jgi:hypothetical protein
MRQRPAERSPVTHLRIRDLRRRRRDQPSVVVDLRVALHHAVRCHRADHQGVAVVADPAQLVDPAEVDDRFERGQPEPQYREQALPAGQHLGVLVVAQQCHRVVDRGRRVVLESCRDHDLVPS